MKCPMRKEKIIITCDDFDCDDKKCGICSDSEIVDYFCDCIKEECAWWIPYKLKGKGNCSIRDISANLENIVVQM